MCWFGDLVRDVVGCALADQHSNGYGVEGSAVVDIELQYFPDCPNWQVAARHLEQALGALGLLPTVRRRLVSDPEEAGRIGFRGSPTILVDGRDPFDGGVPGTFACRSYVTEEGRRGAPSVGQLVAALGGICS